MKLSKQRGLILSLLGALIFSVGYRHASTTTRESDSRPNILFLISDDHSANDINSGGVGPRTPGLQALTAGGLRFANAYVASPQCSPSRAAIVTGRSPHATGTSRLLVATNDFLPPPIPPPRGDQGESVHP